VTVADIEDGLTGIFRATFDNDTLQLSARTTERDIPGWDSVKMVKLILATEERFAIRMRAREIDALKCFGDWVRLVQSKVGG